MCRQVAPATYPYDARLLIVVEFRPSVGSVVEVELGRAVLDLQFRLKTDGATVTNSQ